MKYLKIFEELEQDLVYKSYGVDMTEQAEKGQLQPVIGRKKELTELMWILCRKYKNNPVLIGEPGVGKTAAVEKLAQLLLTDECPPALAGKKLISINLAAVIQVGALGNLISEVKKHNLILFVDEIHTLKQHGDTLKPSLARGELSLVGATTLSEYRESIEKDKALERRFQKVFVNEPSLEECYDILKGIAEHYEKFHRVKYTDESIKACIKLSHRYITDRFLPDKAIDLMDEVGAKVRLSRTKNPAIKELEQKILKQLELCKRLERDQRFEELAAAKDTLEEIKKEFEGAKLTEKIEEITEEMIQEIVQLKTKIPIKVAQGQKEAIRDLPNKLKMDIIGQDEAVVTVSKVIQRNRAGLGNKNRPQGVFLFLGPTGVGKTELVKSLAKNLMGSEDSIIRLDMSEFKDAHTSSRLGGSPPGYVGYGEGGQLTEKVRRMPYSIVLLDEIEKADPSIFDTFLQVFEDGHLTDGQGNKVNFKNTIIVMTSNIGTSIANSVLGFKSSSNPIIEEENKKRLVLTALKQKMRPEFINRIDDIIVFKSLERDNLSKIVDLELKKVADKLKEKNITLTWTYNVEDFVLQYGYDKEMGARPLRRAIQKYVENPISDFIIDDKVSDKIELDAVEVDSNWKLVINGEQINEKKNYLLKKFSLFKN